MPGFALVQRILLVAVQYALFRQAIATQWHFAGCLVQQLLRGMVYQADAGVLVHRDHPFLNRIKDRLALLKQAGNFMRFQPEQNGLQPSDQNIDTQQTDNTAK